MRMIMGVKKSQNLTILQVSHSREEAYGISDRVALIIGGSIIQTGSADNIFRTPQTVAAAKYAGIENIFRGKVLSCDGTFSTLDIDGHQITIKNKTIVGECVTICIAGEDISLVEEPQGTSDTVLNTVSGIITDILPMEHSVKIRIEGALSLMSVIKQNNGFTRLPLHGDHRLAVFHPSDAHLLEEGV